MTEMFTHRRPQVREYFIEIDGDDHPWSERNITVDQLRQLARIRADVAVLEIDSDGWQRRVEEGEVIANPGLVRFASQRRPLSPRGRVNFQEHWLFAAVPSSDLQPVLNVAEEMRFVPGDLIFDEGDQADGLYVVTGGYLVAARSYESETLLVTAAAGDIIGEMGVLDGERRSGTARAAGICSAHFIPAEPFLDLLERSTAVTNRLLILLSGRLRGMNRRLAELPLNV